jgi:tRNA A-37 threonylcarbamoyl transferase component Bud32
MKQKLKLPAGFGFPVWPYKIDSDKIIKAEATSLIWTAQLADGTSAVMKMYYRRGFANFIRGIILNFRVKREFKILKHLASCGVACTIPLSWTYGYCKAYGFYEILHTRQIPYTISLKTLLSSETLTDKNIDLGPLFQLVYNMHRCGVYHGALSTKNILIDPTGNAQVKFYSIDFARGWLFPGSILGKQIAGFDLLKLVRTIESHLSIGSCQAYLAQYGLEKGAIERFYQDAGRYQSYSRKHKRIKNVLKVKVFFYAILTHLNPRGH